MQVREPAGIDLLSPLKIHLYAGARIGNEASGGPGIRLLPRCICGAVRSERMKMYRCEMSFTPSLRTER